MRKFHGFETTIGAVAGTEVPRHHLKIRPIQFLCNASTILVRHDCVVGVDVGDVVAVFVDIR